MCENFMQFSYTILLFPFSPFSVLSSYLFWYVPPFWLGVAPLGFCQSAIFQRKCLNVLLDVQQTAKHLSFGLLGLEWIFCMNVTAVTHGTYKSRWKEQILSGGFLAVAAIMFLVGDESPKEKAAWQSPVKEWLTVCGRAHWQTLLHYFPAENVSEWRKHWELSFLQPFLVKDSPTV